MDPGFARMLALLNLFTHLIAALACFPFERRRRARMPGTRPYTWGIFIGLNAILVGGAFLVGGIGDVLFSDPRPLKTIVAFQTVGGLTAVAAGYAAVRRWRAGLIVAILLSVNVLWWFVGFIYVWKRWAELRGTLNRGF